MHFRKRMGLDGLKLGGNMEIGQNKISGYLENLQWGILEGEGHEEVAALQR